MKKIIIIIALLLIFLYLADVECYAQKKKRSSKKIKAGRLIDSVFNLYGKGTETDPFLIKNLSDLNQLSKVCNNEKYFVTKNKYFKQTKNIVITSNYLQIGTKEKSFCGNYDGNGFDIRFSQVSFAQETYYAVFAVSEGNIYNLSVSGDFNISYNLSNIYAAGIVAFNKGSISKCYNNVNIYAKGTYGDVYVGGISGRSEKGSIIDCYNLADLSSNSENSYCGGIVGWNSTNSDIYNCYSIGKIKGYMIGGIIGMNYGNLENSYFLKFYTDKEINNNVDVVGNNGGKVSTSDSKIENEMKHSNFNSLLSSNYKYVSNDYPKLIWEKSKKKVSSKKKKL